MGPKTQELAYHLLNELKDISHSFRSISSTLYNKEHKKTDSNNGMFIPSYFNGTLVRVHLKSGKIVDGEFSSSSEGRSVSIKQANTEGDYVLLTTIALDSIEFIEEIDAEKEFAEGDTAETEMVNVLATIANAQVNNPNVTAAELCDMADKFLTEYSKEEK